VVEAVSSVVANATVEWRLPLAIVLVELGELGAAEAEVLRLLAEAPQDRQALGLLAKIKHIRGELSAAIACWAQMNALAAEGEGAHMRLATMLHLAEDPERGAGEFLALGQHQLWRKPATLLELEAAFRLFVQRRPDEARAACARLAQKTRHDRDLFKLALLAEAWIAELAGDFGGAVELLEQLGEERGFAGDTDRALALVRVYERRGLPEDLDKAIHVCEYLAGRLQSFERVTALGRLAALSRARGHEDAAEAERRFLAAFQSAMYRPTLLDALTAASHRYLPLRLLARAHFVAAEIPDQAAPRVQALAQALRGELAAAQAGFQALATPLDRKYLADLALLVSDRRGAVRGFLDSLEEDPDDPRVVGWLIDQLDTPEGATVGERLRQPAAQARALAALEAQVRETPRRAAAWRQLAALHALRGDAAEQRRCAERDAALAHAEARRERAVGRVLSAAVYHFAGRAKGLVHEVWAARKPVAAGQGGFLEEILGNLTPELVQAVRNTFAAVREYALANLPHLTTHLLDFNYSFKVTKEDEPSGGLSAGLPAAIAFLSVFLNRPVPQDIAVSGMLVTDAHDVLVVRPVGESEEKVRGAYNRNLRTMLLPEGNGADLARGIQVPQAIWQELVVFTPDLDSAVKLVFGEL
jgi:hypothetical protein